MTCILLPLTNSPFSPNVTHNMTDVLVSKNINTFNWLKLLICFMNNTQCDTGKTVNIGCEITQLPLLQA